MKDHVDSRFYARIMRDMPEIMNDDSIIISPQKSEGKKTKKASESPDIDSK